MGNRLVQVTAMTTVLVACGLVSYIFKTTSPNDDDSNDKSKNQSRYHNFMQTPTPSSAIPLFDHLLLLGSSFALTLSRWHQQYGPLLRLRFGYQSWLLIADPHFANEIFKHNSNIHMTRPEHRYIDEFYSRHRRGLVYSSTKSEKYHTLRSAVLEYLSPECIDEQLIDYEVDTFIERLQEKKNGSNPDIGFDPTLELKLSCINVFMSVAFAKRFDSTDDPDFNELEVIFKGLFPSLGNLASCMPFLNYIPWITSSTRFMSKVARRRDDYFMRLVEYGLNEDSSHCLVKTLYALRDQCQFDPDDILVALTDMYGMSADLPPNVLNWDLAILSNKPEVQDQMRQEIVNFYITHKRLPRYSDRKNLPLVQSVQKECLRYRCSNSLNIPRQFEDDVKCCGILIPKGTICLCAFYAMHMNENTYSKATDFDPFRFYKPEPSLSKYETTSVEMEDHDVFLFGFGPRTCPGLHMVERFMYSLFVRLFYHYRIENPLDADGNYIKVNLDHYVNSDLLARPEPYNVRLVDLAHQIYPLGDHNDSDSDGDYSDFGINDNFSEG